jgi:hypothetical protein
VRRGRASDERLRRRSRARGADASHFDALERADFVVDALREPEPGGALLDPRPRAAPWLERLCFLRLRAVRR